MFAPPPRQTTRVFARLPDKYRKTEPSTDFYKYQPGHLPVHSLLEGPCFDKQGRLWCTDIPWGRIFTVSPDGNFDLIAEYDGEPNGLKFHRDGRIFIADFKNGIVTLDPVSGKITPFIDRVRLERLKAVNDLTFDSRGNLYFTDQGLTGLHDPTGRVFRVSPSGEIDCLLDNIPSPNGLVLDPTESMLYVAVTRANAIWKIPLMKDGSIAKVGLFIQMSGGSGPDGLAIDEAGNLAVAHTGLGVVWLFSSRGEPLLRIDSCEGHATTNIAYGGPARKLLYITEADSGSILVTDTQVAGRQLFSQMES